MLAQGAYEDRILRFIDAVSLDPLLVVSGVGVALVFGAAHALAPGHNKAVGAAWLVGERGGARDAALLGVVVSAMHTLSVIVLGVLLYAGAGSFEAARHIGAPLRLLSGVMVLGVGVWLLYSRTRRRPALEGDHPHNYDELPPSVSPFSRKGLVILGMGGGILPSPSALLVLVTALLSGRAAFGLLLVMAFSVGMAAALVAFGLGVVWGRDRLLSLAGASSPLARLGRALPLVGASAVFAGGAYLTVSGLLALNL